MIIASEKAFVESAAKHGKGTVEGDAPATNAAYTRIISALRELRKTPDKGEKVLAKLLGNENPSVVTWAALYLLPFKEDEAIVALQKVSEIAAPLIAFGAETTLREWRACRLIVE